MIEQKRNHVKFHSFVWFMFVYIYRRKMWKTYEFSTHFSHKDCEKLVIVEEILPSPKLRYNFAEETFSSISNQLHTILMQNCMLRMHTFYHVSSIGEYLFLINRFNSIVCLSYKSRKKSGRCNSCHIKWQGKKNKNTRKLESTRKRNYHLRKIGEMRFMKLSRFFTGNGSV